MRRRGWPGPFRICKTKKTNEENTPAVETLASEIADLVRVVEATELRKAEHAKRVTASATKQEAGGHRGLCREEVAKADLEESLQKEGEDIEMELAEARAKAKNTHNLHHKCDGMIENCAPCRDAGTSRTLHLQARIDKLEQLIALRKAEKAKDIEDITPAGSSQKGTGGALYGRPC